MRTPLKTEDNRERILNVGDVPVVTGPLVLRIAADAEVRSSLVEAIAEISRGQYEQYRELFVASLSPHEQQTYRKAIEIPYAAKDWWRDAHDIYVTWSLAVILKEENRRRNMAGSELLPDWLTTAALLHDRGYALLAGSGDARAAQYGERAGAHWENVTVRLEHALLSRHFAEALLDDTSSALSAKNMNPGDRDALLSVIELHDYPLIGRYEELSEAGRHHFDADSLYSISLISFVKDYLSYLGDTRKFEMLQKSGLCPGGVVLPSALLAVRMDRYFSSPEQLPAGWDLKRFPLIQGASGYGEGSRTMEPVSETARELTAAQFLLLSECCRVLEQTDHVSQFLPWFAGACEAQFKNLSLRAVS